MPRWGEGMVQNTLAPYVEHRRMKLLQQHGSRLAAHKVRKGARRILREKGNNADEVFHIGVCALAPTLGVVERKRGRKVTLSVKRLTRHQARTLSLRWILEAAKRKGGGSGSMAGQLAAEMLAAADGTSPAYEKRGALNKKVLQARSSLR